MKDVDEQYEEFIHKLALQRASERMLLGFIALCVVAAVTLLFYQNNKLDVELKNQQAAVLRHNQFVASNSEQIKEQTKQIESYLLCLGDFFAQPNRQNVTINNLQQCKLNVNAFSSTAATVTTTPVLPPTKEPTTSEPPKSPSTTTSTSTSSSGQSSGGTSASGGGGSGTSLLDRAVQSVVSIPSRIIEAMSGIL